MLKIYRCIFSLVLLNIFLICGCGSGTNTTDTNNFPVVVFSDVHFDPFYDPSTSLFQSLVASDATEWGNIFKTSSITTPSTWGTDTNYPLLVLALSNIRQNQGGSPVIIFTGDILSHQFSQTFYARYGSPTPPGAADVAAMQVFADKTVAFFLEQVRSSVGNIPVMFVVGNNDSYADLGPDSTFLANTAGLFYTNFLKGTVDHQEFLHTFKKGGYYSAEPAGKHLMVIGLNTVLFSPLVGDTESASAAELAWLDSRLASAKAEGKKVWLLMHEPPGANILATAKTVANNGHIKPATTTMMWNQDYQTTFLHILSKYPGIIALTLAGHTHMDEYRILSSSEVLEITPAITPSSGNDPAFKVFTLSHDTYKPTNYSSLNYDLATDPGKFNSYYTFSEAYSVKGLLNDSLAQLFPALVTNNAKQALYRGYYFSGFDSATYITNTNWPVFWCGIGNMGRKDLIDCVNSY